MPPPARPLRWSSLLAPPVRGLLHVHRDEGGNFGIFLLLIIWALLLLIAMVWNTAEASTRRAHIQNASDTSAHAFATWMIRVTNQEAATNMAMSENASAENLLRSVQPTTDQIAARSPPRKKTSSTGPLRQHAGPRRKQRARPRIL